MSITKKRAYKSESRGEQAIKTRSRILKTAKKLFEKKGFEKVTIVEIAKEAEVSSPSIYALYQSKKGLLLAILDNALSFEHFDELVALSKKEKDPKNKLAVSARIARELYDAERKDLGLLKSASILDPIFKELEDEREKRRYDRQEETVTTIMKEKGFKAGLTVSKIRDILWAFTGRDFYRMFVIERGWSSDAYQEWLANALAQALLKS